MREGRGRGPGEGLVARSVTEILRAAVHCHVLSERCEEITRSAAHLVPLTVEEHRPGLDEYLLAVSGARVDVLLDDPPVLQLDGDAVVEQPHHVQLGLHGVYRGPRNKIFHIRQSHVVYGPFPARAGDVAGRVAVVALEAGDEAGHTEQQHQQHPHPSQQDSPH